MSIWNLCCTLKGPASLARDGTSDWGESINWLCRKELLNIRKCLKQHTTIIINENICITKSNKDYRELLDVCNLYCVLFLFCDSLLMILDGLLTFASLSWACVIASILWILSSHRELKYRYILFVSCHAIFIIISTSSSSFTVTKVKNDRSHGEIGYKDFHCELSCTIRLLPFAVMIDNL